MFYVYLLKSKKDGRLYIGYSRDPNTRLKYHNAGKNRSTRSRRPFVLLGAKSFDTKNKARFFEYSIKRSASKRYRFIKEVSGE